MRSLVAYSMFAEGPLAAAPSRFDDHGGVHSQHQDARLAGLQHPQPIRTAHFGVAESAELVTPRRRGSDNGGLLPALTAGALVCCLILLEGVFVLSDTSKGDMSKIGAAAGVQTGNEFHRVEWFLLKALGIGDLSMAGLGLIGMALAAGAALPPGLAARREAAAGGAAGHILAWRALVTIAIVPWIGYLCVFEPPEYTRWPRILGTMVYLAFNMYMLQVLVGAYAAAKRESRLLEEEFSLGLSGSSREALTSGIVSRSSLAESNVIFWCLPLDLTVAVYAVVASVASLYRVIALLQTNRSSGGWAILMHEADVPSSTFWLEAIGYVTTVVIAACAAGAIIAHWRLDRKAIEYQEDLVVQLPARRRCAGLLLLFFIVGALRFALWVPITGMAMANRDICGLYVQGLAAVALNTPVGAASAADRCTLVEWMVLASVAGFLALDVYLLSASHQLWIRSRMVCIASEERAKEEPLFRFEAASVDRRLS